VHPWVTFYDTEMIRVINKNGKETKFWGEVSYEGVSKSFRTGRLERKLQMIQLSATRCSCIAIL